jgi:hypothetical protein
MLYIHFGSKVVRKFALKWSVWKLNYGPSVLIAYVLKWLQMRTHPNWLLLLAVLFALLLSGCAATPVQCLPATPPKELLIPPPPPGAMQDRLEQILNKGQTSAPSSAS